MSIQETLDKRHKQYGKYEDQLRAKTLIIEACKELYFNVHGKEMDTFHEMALVEITTKLTRVASNFEHSDSWHDLSGYAKLIEEVVLNNEKMTYDKAREESDGTTQDS